MEHNLSKDAVIIVLTANAVSGARKMFLEQGFHDYLSKPIIAVKLEKMIRKYLPEELILNTSSQQQGLPINECGANKPAATSEKDIVDWEKGKEYCVGDEAFYTEMLKTFLESHSDVDLLQYYEASDFENYRIKIHAMKTNLANIGATEASEMAKKLELALKNENDVHYVQEHHEEFILIYRNVVSAVEKYIENE